MQKALRTWKMVLEYIFGCIWMNVVLLYKGKGVIVRKNRIENGKNYKGWYIMIYKLWVCHHGQLYITCQWGFPCVGKVDLPIEWQHSSVCEWNHKYTTTVLFEHLPWDWQMSKALMGKSADMDGSRIWRYVTPPPPHLLSPTPLPQVFLPAFFYVWVELVRASLNPLGQTKAYCCSCIEMLSQSA